MTTRKLQLAGNQYNRLTVVEEVDDPRPGSYWLTRCQCGTMKVLRGGAVVSGVVKSCGCLNAELKRARGAAKRGIPRTHGGTRTREFRSWESMKQRCLNPRHPKYHHYGGRGIVIAPEWERDFGQFLADMGPRPANTTLDRIDVNGNYEPTNCRWATHLEQRHNRRDSPIPEEIS